MTLTPCEAPVRVGELTGTATGYEPEAITPAIQPLDFDLWRLMAGADNAAAGPAVAYNQDTQSGPRAGEGRRPYPRPIWTPKKILELIDVCLELILLSTIVCSHELIQAAYAGREATVDDPDHPGEPSRPGQPGADATVLTRPASRDYMIT